MDDSAAREVERAHLLQPAARPPHPVGQGRVHQRGPEDEEGEIGAEPHPLAYGARDKRRCDHGKHRLKTRVRLVRDRRRIRIRIEPDAPEHHPRQAAEPRRSGRERERVADHHPEHADRAHGHDAHHHRVERVLGAHEPAVKAREPDRHEEHERARGKHPRGIAGAYGRGLRHASSAARNAACCTSLAFTAVSAPLFCSPVRMRITRSLGWPKILPSPTSPVRADDRIASMQGCTNGSEQTISIFTFSWNSMTRVVPRYWLTISCSPPWPLTRLSVMPVMPARNSAALTSGSTSGRTIVVINFIVTSERRTRAAIRRALARGSLRPSESPRSTRRARNGARAHRRVRPTLRHDRRPARSNRSCDRPTFPAGDPPESLR